MQNIKRIATINVVVAACLLAFAGAANAQAQARVDQARIANVVQAAQLLARTELEKGLGGAFTEMRACYERELPHAQMLTRSVEGCMTQDMIVSRVIAEASTKMTPEARQKANTPDPQVVMNAMVERTIDVFTRLKVSQEDASEFVGLVRNYGMDAYGKVRFPDKVK